MKFVAATLQTDIVQIGRSVGVVLEFNFPNMEEAVRGREVLATVISAAVQTSGGLSLTPLRFSDLDGEELGEVFKDIIETAIRRE